MAVGAGGRAALKRNRIGIAIASALVLLAGCVPATPEQLLPLPENTGAPTTTTVRLDDRTALLYVPANRSSGTPVLVVALHGYTGDAQGGMDFLGLRSLADRRGFLVLAPQGTTDQEGHTFWNASRACCNFEGSAVDDSAYLSRVIASVASAYTIDPARVYLVGHSNGGFMAQRFACDHADQVAAIASVAGALDTDAACEPAEPVSMVQVHGTADETILYGGGQINGASYTSAAATVARWRTIDGCPAASTPGARLDADADVEGDDLAPNTWTGCRGGTAVALWTISDGRHVPTLTAAFTAALLDWFEAAGRQ
jgi:polyhydroxybutyrate depolymerase